MNNIIHLIIKIRNIVVMLFKKANEKKNKTYNFIGHFNYY